MHWVRGSVAAALAVSVLFLAACGAGTGQSKTAAAQRTVTTSQGEINIPADPKRIVVLNNSLTGYLFNLDLPVTATVPEWPGTQGQYDAAWADQATADGTTFLPWSTDGFNLESIAKTNPDLIIGGGLGMPGAQATEAYDQLSGIAPTVLVPKELGTWQQQLGFLANDIFDMPDQYAELVQAYDQRVAEIRDQIKPPPAPATVLSVLGNGNPYGVMDDASILQILDSVGVKTAKLSTEYNLQPYRPGGDMFTVSEEQVGEVFDVPTIFVVPFDDRTLTADKLKQNKTYNKLPAFKDGNAYDLPYRSLRTNYDDALNLLEILDKQFG